MGYSPTRIGIREAITDAVISRVQAKIPDFVTALNRDSQTSPLVGNAFGGGLTGTTCVVRGDPEADWPAIEGAFRFFVSSGAAKNGLSIESVIEYIEMGQKKTTYHTFISAVLHPSAYQYRGQGDNVIQVQASKREYALDRLQDWTNAVWNDVGYDSSSVQLTLTSTDISATADKLKRVMAPLIFREIFMRMPGDTVGMWGVHTVVTGIVSA